MSIIFPKIDLPCASGFLSSLPKTGSCCKKQTPGVQGRAEGQDAADLGMAFSSRSPGKHPKASSGGSFHWDLVDSSQLISEDARFLKAVWREQGKRFGLHCFLFQSTDMDQAPDSYPIVGAS